MFTLEHEWEHRMPDFTIIKKTKTKYVSLDGEFYKIDDLKYVRMLPWLCVHDWIVGGCFFFAFQSFPDLY